jgi:hypothetical protein
MRFTDGGEEEKYVLMWVPIGIYTHFLSFCWKRSLVTNLYYRKERDNVMGSLCVDVI